MENLELLQAMRQMMEEVVSPIYERMDRMEAEFTSLREEVSSVKEEVASVKEEVSSVKVLATKTQITLENDIRPKINLLLKGTSLSKIAFRSWIAWKKCCGNCGMMCKICNTLYRGIVTIFAGSSAVVTQIKSKPNSKAA